MTAMRTALLGTTILLLAASPALADQPVVTGADLIARCAMPDVGNQTLCNLYLSDVMRQLDWPAHAFGLTLEGVTGMQWEGCPSEKPGSNIAHWRVYLPQLVAKYWREKPAYPAPLGALPWRQAMVTTLTSEFTCCAASGTS